MMKLSIEWDEDKVRANLKKNRIGFAEAATVFTDPSSVTIHDHDHSAYRECWGRPCARGGLDRTRFNHTSCQLSKGNSFGAEIL